MKTNNKHINKTGFKTPTNYFNQLEDVVFDKIDIQQETKSILPKKLENSLKVPDTYFDSFENRLLDTLNNNKTTLPENLKNGLSVPKGYFENLEEVISEKTNVAKKEHKKNTKAIPLFSRKNILYITGIAAMIAVIFSVFVTKPTSHSLNFDTITVADIEDYFDNGNTELSEMDFVSFLDDETSLADIFTDNEISDEMLLDYLSDEQIENEMISIEQ